MKIEYHLPSFIEGHLSGISEEQLQKLITMLLEYAINHRMLDYPKMKIESDVEETLNITKKIKSGLKRDSMQTLELLKSVNTKLDKVLTLNAQRDSYEVEEPVIEIYKDEEEEFEIEEDEEDVDLFLMDIMK